MERGKQATPREHMLNDRAYNLSYTPPLAYRRRFSLPCAGRRISSVCLLPSFWVLLAV